MMVSSSTKGVGTEAEKPKPPNENPEVGHHACGVYLCGTPWSSSDAESK